MIFARCNPCMHSRNPTFKWTHRIGHWYDGNIPLTLNSVSLLPVHSPSGQWGIWIPRCRLIIWAACATRSNWDCDANHFIKLVLLFLTDESRFLEPSTVFWTSGPDNSNQTSFPYPQSNLDLYFTQVISHRVTGLRSQWNLFLFFSGVEKWVFYSSSY